MNSVRYIPISILLLCLTSCNQGRIDELEYEVSKLEKENEALQSHIEELENVIAIYESSQAQYSAQENQRNWHQQNARQHLQTAEFWRENGNEFLYESSMRNAQQKLNMIP